MKLFYTAFLLCLSLSLFSQIPQLGPLHGNPVLRSYAAQEEVRKARAFERKFGFDPLKNYEARVMHHCPPDLPLGENIVEAGSSLTVTLDTFGLVGPASDTVFTLLTDPIPTLGMAELLANSINLRFTANDDFQGLGEETILVEIAQGGERDTIATVFVVKRKGETVTLPTQVLDPEEVTTVCLDGFLDFESPLACAELLPCVDDYPGEGNQLFYLSSFPGVDTCLIYEASRFPGVDTVCVMVCDELAVCDEFKIPFEITGEVLTVDAANPFFDDFSSYDGPYPSAKYWLDLDVFLNYTLADNPPSVGLVTFDGLDRRGRPYNIVNSGVGDKLTSQPMDLSNFGANDPLALRYFVAPKGFGQEPELNDTLKVEFLNNQGKWMEVAFETGDDLPIDSVPPFEFRGIEIDDPQFLHDAFQFRFVARVSPGGYGDWWHLDYVYLGQVDAETSNFKDHAFSKKPNVFLENYTSMPFRHLKNFTASEVSPNVEATFFNFFENVRTITSSNISFRETTTDTDLGIDFSIVDGENLFPMVHEIRTVQNPEVGALRNSIAALQDDDFLNIEIEYVMDPNDAADVFFTNDTVRLNIPFSNYFARDDGTAERAYFIFQVQGYEQVAQRFHANVEDELHAVQIMFPHFTIGEFEDQFFTLKIWIDENADGLLGSEDEVFERELLRPFFADNVYDTLQGFTTYILEDFTGTATPVTIPAGTDFYVGWQYGSNAQLSFTTGFDLQNDCNCIFEDLDGSGINLSTGASTFDGALMVRPVMEPVPFNTSSGTADVAPAKAPLSIFPNPTGGRLNLKLEDGNYEDYKLLVFNQLGQIVAQPQSAPTLELEGLENGVYFLQISDLRTGGHFIKRFLKNGN